jgi:autotransporter translocation and assembly factor TamB
LATPIIVADAAARHVSLGQVKLGAADASIDVDWINGQRNEASITASQLEIPGQVIDSLRIDLRGARDSHQLAAEIVSRDADVSLSAVGGFSERSWAGELVGVSIDSPEYGGWGVAEPTRLSVSDNSVVVSLLCLRERAGGVCLEGSWEKEVGWRAEAVFNEFPLEVLRFALPEGWALEGSVSGELSGSAVRGWPQQLDLDLQPSDGELTYLLADSAHVLRYRQARLAVHADPDSTRARVDIDLAEAGKEDYGSFDLYANLPPLRALADEFSLEGEPQRGWLGEAVVRDFPLSLIDLVLPEGWAAEGTVSGSMALALMVDRPQRLAVDLYPSAGALTYAIGDSTHGIRYREGHVAVRSNPDSLWGQVDLQLSEASADEYGALRIHANLPPLSSLRTEVASEGWGETLIDGWVLAASMNDAPLSLAKPFLPSGMSLSGALDGEIDADVAPDGSLGGEIRLQAQNAAMHRLVGREVRTVRIADTRISGRAGAEGLHGDLVLKFARPDSGSLATITGSLGFPSYVNLHQEFTEQALEARIDGQMDLGLIDALVEGLAGSSGQLDIEIDVGGTVDEPLTSGHYVVNGQTNVPSLGLTLRDIEVRATSRTRGDFEIEGGLSSGAGRLAISGRSPPIPSSESPARITVQGSDFLAAQTDQVTLVVSPDLEVLLTGEQVIVNGDVTVPRAAIEILEVPETAASVSEDVVFVGDTIVEERRPLDVSAEVRLVLGEDVTFRGFGFSTHLDGTIVTTETPGRGTEGRGELVFREGRYRGFGQSLTIDPGRLVFAGPVDDPTLDVRAYRRADDGTRAGFLIGGTLQSPEVEVWSDPARSQQEALSYILFGRPLDQGTESDRAQAGSEAAILGGNILAMSMATRVGLDEARIETGNRREDAAFYAGKYLSPKLYVAYGVGLYEPVNVIRVRYIISRKLSLQAETGSRDSGDILYRIEF